MAKCWICGNETGGDKLVCTKCDVFEGVEPCTRTETEYNRLEEQRKDLILENDDLRQTVKRLRMVINGLMFSLGLKDQKESPSDDLYMEMAELGKQ